MVTQTQTNQSNHYLLAVNDS